MPDPESRALRIYVVFAANALAVVTIWCTIELSGKVTGGSWRWDAIVGGIAFALFVPYVNLLHWDYVKELFDRDMRSAASLWHRSVGISATFAAGTALAVVAVSLVSASESPKEIQGDQDQPVSELQSVVEATEVVERDQDEPQPNGRSALPLEGDSETEGVDLILARVLFGSNVSEFNLNRLGYGDDDPDGPSQICDQYGDTHTGWHVEGKSASGNPQEDIDFHSLTKGVVIKAQDGHNYGVIAVWDESARKTTIYMLARRSYVKIGAEVMVGQKLGVQGGWPLDGTNGQYIHVEVREGKQDWMACSSTQEGSVDPIRDPYLYESIQSLNQ